MIYVPSVDQIKEWHRLLIDRYGGSHGILATREPLLSSAIEAVYNRVAYHGDERPDHLAALLCARLALAHVFIDGNKRVAVAAMQVMLLGSGLYIPPSRQGEIYDALIGLLENKYGEEEFCGKNCSLVTPLERGA